MLSGSVIFQFPTGFSRIRLVVNIRVAVIASFNSLPDSHSRSDEPTPIGTISLSIPYRILTFKDLVFTELMRLTFNSLPDSHCR